MGTQDDRVRERDRHGTGARRRGDRRADGSIGLTLFPSGVDDLSRRQCFLNCLGSDLKGGIKDFDESVRLLIGEVVLQRHREERPLAEDRKVPGLNVLGKRDRVRMRPAVSHRHLRDHHDHGQPEPLQGPDELRFGLLEPAVTGPHAIPGDVEVLGERPAPHRGHVVGELGEDLRVVDAHLDAAGVVDAEELGRVHIQVRLPGDRFTDPGGGDLLTEDGVDQRALADSVLPKLARLNRPYFSACSLYARELVSEPVVGSARHESLPASVRLICRRFIGAWCLDPGSLPRINLLAPVWSVDRRWTCVASATLIHSLWTPRGGGADRVGRTGARPRRSASTASMGRSRTGRLR